MDFITCVSGLVETHNMLNSSNASESVKSNNKVEVTVEVKEINEMLARNINITFNLTNN